MGHRYRRRGFQLGNHHQSGRHHRNNRHRSHHRNRINYHYALGLCAISLAGAVHATEVSNIAGPQAAATSNNTNTSMQFNNNGAPSRQHMGKGVSCNGPTLNVTPFFLGADTHTDSYTRSGNFGIQIGLAAPLDGSISEMCKELARQRIYKEKLDSLLIRAKECANLYDRGYMLDPKSQLGSLCSGVVSIAAYQKFQAQDDPVALQDASYQSSKQVLKDSRDALEALRQQVFQLQQQLKRPQQSQQQ